jgi:hypothetical protein
MNSSVDLGSDASPYPEHIDGARFAKGMAILRVFVGVIFFANGLAKLEPELGRIDVGWYHGNLITQQGARGILNFEVNDRQVREGAPRGTKVPGIKWITIRHNRSLLRWPF